jgi:predicted nucleotidyltransferase
MLLKDVFLNKIKYQIFKTDPNAKIFLYGSRARGDHGKMSDWDLLILLNSKDLPFQTETDLLDELYEIELETGEVISPLFYTKKEWFENRSNTPLFENIKNEGILIS